jgi:hypothetical protein
MFLDDLPAAVKMEKTKTYDDHIPIGFLPKTKNNTINDDSWAEDKPDRDYAIYNHLDITVLTHNTLLSS